MKTLTASYVLDSSLLKGGVDDANAELGRLEGSSAALSDAVDKDTSRMGSMFKSLGNSMGQFGIPLAGAVTQMGEKLDKAKGEGTSFISVMSSVGKIATGVVAVGLIAAGGASLKMATDYQRSVDQLAGSAGITVKQANAIGNAFLDTGGKSIFSGTQMVQAFGPVAGQLKSVQGSALTTSESLKVMMAASTLAEASGNGLASTTKDLANVMQAFQVPVSGVNRVSNELYATSRSTGVGLDTLTSTVDRLKARLGVVSPSVQQMGTMLVDLADHGVQGSRGLLVVNSAMTTLLGVTDKVSTAQAKAADTYATKLASAQKAVASASTHLSQVQEEQGVSAEKSSITSANASQALAQAQERDAAAVQSAQEQLATAESKSAQSSSTAQVSAASAVAKAQEALSAKQAEIAASGKTTVTDQMDLQKLQMSLTDAQQKQAQAGASQSSSIASAQLALQRAQSAQSQLLSTAQSKGALAAVTAQGQQLSSSVSLTNAQSALAAAQAKLQTVQTAGGQSTNATVQAMQQLGLSVYDSSGKFVGMGSVIAQLSPKLKQMTEQQQMQALAAVFGKSANKALLDTVLAGPAAWDKAQKAVEAKNAAEAAAQKQDQALGRELDTIKASIVDTATKWGEKLIPAVQEAGRVLAGTVQFFMHNRTAAIALGVAIGGPLAAAMTIFAVRSVGKAIGAAKDLGTSILHLGSVFSKASGGMTEEQAASQRLEQSMSKLVTALDKAVAANDSVSQAQSGVAEATAKQEAAAAQLSSTLVEQSSAQQEYATAVRASKAASNDLELAQTQLASASGTELAEAQARVATATEAAEAAMQRENEAASALVASMGEKSAAQSEYSASLKLSTDAASQLQVAEEQLAASEGGLAEAGSSLEETNAAIASSNEALAASYAAIDEAQTTLEAGFAGLTAAEEDFAATSEATGEASSLAFGPVGIAIMALVTVGTLVATHWKQIEGLLKDAWGAIKAAGVDVWHALESAWHAVDSTAHAVFDGIVDFFKKWGTLVLAAIFPVVGIPLLIAQHWGQIVNIAHSAFDAVVNFLGQLPGRMLSALGNVGSLFINAGKDVLHGLWVGLQDFAQIERFFYVTIPEKILGAMASAGTWLLHAGEDIIDGLVKGVEMLSPIYWILKYKNDILAGLKDAGQWLVSAGKDIMHGLVKGIESIPVVGSVVKAGSDIIHSVTHLFGIFSPSTVFADIGANLMKGLAQGITANKQLASDEMKNVKLTGDLDAELTKLEGIGAKVAADLSKAGQGLLELGTDGKSAEASIGPVVTTIGAIASALKDTGSIRLPAGLSTDLKTLATLATQLHPQQIVQAVTAIEGGLSALANDKGLSQTLQRDEVALDSFAGHVKPAETSLRSLATSVSDTSKGFASADSDVSKIEGSLKGADSAASKLAGSLGGDEKALKSMTLSVMAARVALGLGLVGDLQKDEAEATKVGPVFTTLATQVGGASKQVKATVSDWDSLGKSLDKTGDSARSLGTDLQHDTDQTKSLGDGLVRLDTELTKELGLVTTLTSSLVEWTDVAVKVPPVLSDISKGIDVFSTESEREIDELTRVHDAFGLAGDGSQEYERLLLEGLDALQRFDDGVQHDLDILADLADRESDVTGRTGQLASALSGAVVSFDQLGDAADGLGARLDASLNGVDQNLYNQMSNIGGDMISGLDDSLNANKGQVLTTVENVMGGVLNTMKAMMGIASPSTVTAGIADNVMQGLVLGVQRGESPFVAAVTGALKSATSAASSQLDGFVTISQQYGARVSTQYAQQQNALVSAVTARNAALATQTDMTAALARAGDVNGSGVPGVPTTVASSPTLPSAAPAQAPQVNVYVTVQGNVVTENDLQQSLKRFLISDAQINGTIWSKL